MILQKQYALIQGSREVVFNFIDTQVGTDLNTPVPAFENRAVRYLLMHNANTYFHWLSYFALKKPFDLLNDENFTNINLIRPVYTEVDNTMAFFIENFKEQLDLPLYNTLSRNRQVSATPLQLFTHVITHEFHHKGQIMSMCRLLGYTPPDTDVIRF
ncbi:MAG: DinB family protein [Mucilaginibacter sp.]|jgi:uncharacterized damage-inducible protein DinB|nr:DinB family protein [Mucilaginibacter sp.]